MKPELETPQTLTEKIVQRDSAGFPLGKKVKAGDYVTLSPHHCITHDNLWPVALKFMSIGASKNRDNKQIVMGDVGISASSCNFGAAWDLPKRRPIWQAPRLSLQVPCKVAGPAGTRSWKVVVCDADNIDIGGIYPGNSREGDIIVSGFDFGCDSSPEQDPGLSSG